MAIHETRIGGGLLRELAGRDAECGTARATEIIRSQGVVSDSEIQPGINQLLQLLARKSAVLVRVRRDLRYGALMNLWLGLHVPLALATVVAVLIHVFVVFYYW